MTTGPLTTCTKQTTLFGPNGLFKFTAGSKADSKPGFKIFQDPVEAKKPEKIENPPEHFRSVQVQTKLSAHPRDSSAGKSVDWTFALDEEAQKLKDLADSRAKELEIDLKENKILKIRNLELREENYNHIKDKEECLEIIEQAKEIAKILNPLVNGDDPTSALHEMEENQENKPPPESQE